MMIIIVKNARGGYSLDVNGRAIGNYATAADAERIARLNGWQIVRG